MARRPRLDTPGSWHHVINRAIAKRPYFETRSDKRYFLARLAQEVRAGRLEVHAYCLMDTHFHLLVRSPIGELSEAMRRIQCAYSRYFNRRRRRDGPLIRGRFFSKLVRTDSYRTAVVRYIDNNAVRARVAANAAEYEFGSARRFLSSLCPRWLSSDWVVSRALERSGAKAYSASAYLAAFGPRVGKDLAFLCDLVELRMASSCELDPLDDLIGASPLQVRQWMARKAKLADGMEVGLPVCAPPAVGRALKEHLEARGEWHVEVDSRTWKGSQLAQVGLLVDLCGTSSKQIARICGVGLWSVRQRVEMHRASMAVRGEYASNASEIALAALASTFPD